METHGAQVQPTNLQERAFNVTVVIFALVTFSSFVPGSRDGEQMQVGCEMISGRSPLTT